MKPVGISDVWLFCIPSTEAVFIALQCRYTVAPTAASYVRDTIFYGGNFALQAAASAM